ncbi:MAG: Fur family transcriptional regulator [Candidatus Bipolaricaulota bacterium]|nr:Fur family transcriptional regulator [Candidatus Bipolaricaulota bacterium]
MLVVDIADIERKLKEHGLKITKSRRAILRVISRSSARLSPAQIHRRARRSYRRLGLVTVYRTLALLEELGLAQRVHTETDCHSFAPVRAPEGHHHPLICKECGRVEEFSQCGSERLLARLQRETGFAIESHHLEVIGYCPKCQ